MFADVSFEPSGAVQTVLDGLLWQQCGGLPKELGGGGQHSDVQCSWLGANASAQLAAGGQNECSLMECRRVVASQTVFSFSYLYSLIALWRTDRVVDAQGNGRPDKDRRYVGKWSKAWTREREARLRACGDMWPSCTDYGPYPDCNKWGCWASFEQCSGSRLLGDPFFDFPPPPDGGPGCELEYPGRPAAAFLFFSSLCWHHLERSRCTRPRHVHDTSKTCPVGRTSSCSRCTPLGTRRCAPRRAATCCGCSPCSGSGPSRT